MPGQANVALGNLANLFYLRVPVPAGAAFAAGPNTTERTYTVSGLRLGDSVFVNKPTNQSGVAIGNVRVSAADTLAISFVITNGTPTLTAEDYLLMVCRPGYDNPSVQSPTAIV